MKNRPENRTRGRCSARRVYADGNSKWCEIVLTILNDFRLAKKKINLISSIDNNKIFIN